MFHLIHNQEYIVELNIHTSRLSEELALIEKKDVAKFLKYRDKIFIVLNSVVHMKSDTNICVMNKERPREGVKS